MPVNIQYRTNPFAAGAAYFMGGRAQGRRENAQLQTQYAMQERRNQAQMAGNIFSNLSGMARQQMAGQQATNRQNLAYEQAKGMLPYQEEQAYGEAFFREYGMTPAQGEELYVDNQAQPGATTMPFMGFMQERKATFDRQRTAQGYAAAGMEMGYDPRDQARVDELNRANASLEQMHQAGEIGPMDYHRQRAVIQRDIAAIPKKPRPITWHPAKGQGVGQEWISHGRLKTRDNKGNIKDLGPAPTRLEMRLAEAEKAKGGPLTWGEERQIRQADKDLNVFVDKENQLVTSWDGVKWVPRDLKEDPLEKMVSEQLHEELATRLLAHEQAIRGDVNEKGEKLGKFMDWKAWFAYDANFRVGMGLEPRAGGDNQAALVTRLENKLNDPEPEVRRKAKELLDKVRAAQQSR